MKKSIKQFASSGSWSAAHAKRARESTCRLLELVDEGVVDRYELILALVNWMSESDVAEFCQRNGYFESEEETDEEEDERS